MRSLTVIVACTLLLAMSSTFGQDQTEPISVPQISEELWPSMVKMVVAVAAIVILIYVFAILAKRFSLSRSGRFGGGGSLHILERSYFSPKKFICLARVGEKVLLLGISESSINLVADVSDQEFSIEDKKKEKNQRTSFKTYFQQAKSGLSTLVSKV